MAEQYGFSNEQKKYLNELLKDENHSLWAAVLYGINASDEQIVSIALGEVGNVGGEKYWRWYGFNSKVEWCACFVSWCANECGYIDTGIIPKFALCSDGADWFKSRKQWLDRSSVPSAGMIAFFDWNNENGQDGSANHVGIVQKVENGKVYIIEGNTSNSCKVKEYSLDYYEILGYGVSEY